MRRREFIAGVAGERLVTTMWTDVEVCDSLEQARAWIEEEIVKGGIHSHPKPTIHELHPTAFVIHASADFHVDRIDYLHLGTFQTSKAAQEFVDRQFRRHRIHPDPRHKNKPAAAIKQFYGRFLVTGAPRPR
jgi:hypothetical protein